MNIYNYLYLGLRFTPFVLVSFLTAWMILNQDIRIMIFMAGFCLTCLVTILLGNYVGTLQGIVSSVNGKSTEMSCNMLNLTDNTPLSFFPLSLVLYSYTLFYLIMLFLMQPLTIRARVVYGNLAILVFLGLVMSLEFIWLMVFCTFWWKVMVSVVVGGTLGLFWSFLISNTSLAVYQNKTVTHGEGDCLMTGANSYTCKSGNLVTK